MAKLTFKLPAEVEIPDGKTVGDSFQAIATFILMPNGGAELTQVDGEPLDGVQTGNQTQAKPTDDATQSAIPSMFGGSQ